MGRNIKETELFQRREVFVSDYFEGAEVILNDRGAAIKIIDDNGG